MSKVDKNVDADPSVVNREVVELDKSEKPSKSSNDAEKAERYSVYSKREKWFLVSLASLSALLSPLTANIYFPALPVLSTQFHKSLELINLTVTSYMVFQGIAPAFWAPIADRYGRRLVFIMCLSTLSLSCVGLALTPTNAYWLLLLLRCFQAAGSASTVAISAGLIVDIAEPAERGGFLGVYSLGPMAGPAFGPIIGGALSGSLGWRAIFWFMCIFAGCVLVVIILVLPETLRSLVGDGSIPPPRFLRPVIRFGNYTTGNNSQRPPKKPWANPARLFVNPDVVLILLPNAVVCAVYYGVSTTISILFQQKYPFLTQTDIGLCYIAIGGGCIPGSYVNGKLLDRHYKAAEREYKAKKAESSSENPEESEKPRSPFEQKMDVNFPLERARLQMIPYNLAVFVACTVGYGWSLEAGVHISVPLILSFFIGWSFIAIMNISQTFIMDLFPTQGSSITASNNLIRCTSGAALVAVEQLIIDAINPGWTFVIFGGLCVVLYPMMHYEMINGHKFRERRMKRLAEKARKEAETEAEKAKQNP
ncbi:MFS general substrate transporter [Sistotremastrum suecicum HHB10207 ss-3]|uniref:MFS general substrate transporter n=1 Tax=Sistotremastrum suecicum HHB10207 ss-3 TaxID=1314776 RepID=A0A165Z936_9AGAM|nr:MFS general substrate transporter [Sistotremastrum suecicum HHB10207 ss-3]